tara:strand:+ start:156 stop:548 length:393 start_codon:yes stop_codon:yes gene_type:complete
LQEFAAAQNPSSRISSHRAAAPATSFKDPRTKIARKCTIFTFYFLYPSWLYNAFRPGSQCPGQKKSQKSNLFIPKHARELAGAPGGKTQDGRFTLSRFLAIYGSLGVCGMAARAAGPGRKLSTGYPQQRL